MDYEEDELVKRSRRSSERKLVGSKEHIVEGWLIAVQLRLPYCLQHIAGRRNFQQSRQRDVDSATQSALVSGQ